MRSVPAWCVCAATSRLQFCRLLREIVRARIGLVANAAKLRARTALAHRQQKEPEAGRQVNLAGTVRFRAAFLDRDRPASFGVDEHALHGLRWPQLEQNAWFRAAQHENESSARPDRRDLQAARFD